MLKIQKKNKKKPDLNMAQKCLKGNQEIENLIHEIKGHFFFITATNKNEIDIIE